MKRILTLVFIIFLIGCSINNTNSVNKETKVTLNSNEIIRQGENITFKIYEFHFERTNGQPNEYIDTINGAIGDSIEIVLINGDEYGENRVSSAKISLNDIELFTPKNFNQNVDTLRKIVVLTNDYNELVVRVMGSPGGFIDFNVYYTVALCQFDAKPIVSFVDEETGDTIQLEDPYFPSMLYEEEMEKIFEYEQEQLANHNSNTLSFSRARRGDIITVGVKKCNWPVKIYLITHDGIVLKNNVGEYNKSSTIHAHPNADNKNGVHYIHYFLWHGYDWIQFDRVTYNTAILNNVVNYATAQENEPYSYAAWSYKYYTYKWCCSSLVWRSYYNGSGRYFDLDCQYPRCSISPLEIVRDPATRRIAYQFN